LIKNITGRGKLQNKEFLKYLKTDDLIINAQNEQKIQLMH